MKITRAIFYAFRYFWQATGSARRLDLLSLAVFCFAFAHNRRTTFGQKYCPLASSMNLLARLCISSDSNAPFFSHCERSHSVRQRPPRFICHWQRSSASPISPQTALFWQFFASFFQIARFFLSHICDTKGKNIIPQDKSSGFCNGFFGYAEQNADPCRSCATIK